MLNPYEGGVFRVTSKYGYRDIGYGAEFHGGLDLVGESSKRLLAVCDGVIETSTIITNKADLTWQWGNYVKLKADTGELIYYCHLSEKLVKKGQRVKKGDVIGIEGQTGFSFGSHCHLEVRNSANKVTELVNTPMFTGIPNIIQKITVETEKEDDKPMTAEEKKAFEKLQRQVDELRETIPEKEKIYHWWKELPSWAYDPLMALYKAGLFVGESPDDLNISYEFMRMLVVYARGLKKQGVIDYEE